MSVCPFAARAALSNQFALCLAAGKLAGQLEGAVSVVRARPAIELRSLPRGQRHREQGANGHKERESLFRRHCLQEIGNLSH